MQGPANRCTALVVDDDPTVVGMVSRCLRDDGIEVLSATTAPDAMALLREPGLMSIVLDLSLRGIRGTDLLSQMRAIRPSLPVVVVTGQAAIEDAVQCMKLGAFDYVTKPVDAGRLATALRDATAQGRLLARAESLARAGEPSDGFGSLLGRSAAIRRVVALLLRATRTDVTVLLQGESGTGKEVAARAIHAEGARRARPFVAVNCGAIPEALIESELFGHEKGAFTGASRMHVGRFEQADGGTIFLDEIGELRPDLQVRLLRVLQDRAIQRVGSQTTKRVDVRVIAASCRILKDEVAAGAFREDLYYRLAVFPVEMPPLRERGDDIALLAEIFLRRFADRQSLPLRPISEEARRALLAYRWPGNVRELENIMELATILEDGPTISVSSLPEEVAHPATAALSRKERRSASSSGTWRRLIAPPPRELRPPGRLGALPAGEAGPPQGDPVAALASVERSAILDALHTTAWNIKRAAILLGIGRATIYRKIDRYGLRAAQPPG